MLNQKDDHALLLQLERTFEAVEEKLNDLNREVADHTQVQCDCDCMYQKFTDRDDFDDLRGDVLNLNRQVLNLSDKLDELNALVRRLKAR
jgi:hypothetical protein